MHVHLCSLWLMHMCSYRASSVLSKQFPQLSHFTFCIQASFCYWKGKLAAGWRSDNLTEQQVCWQLERHFTLFLLFNNAHWSFYCRSLLSISDSCQYTSDLHMNTNLSLSLGHRYFHFLCPIYSWFCKDGSQADSGSWCLNYRRASLVGFG